MEKRLRTLTSESYSTIYSFTSYPFIEKWLFNSFNDSLCLKRCVKMHKRILEVSVIDLGGDMVYAYSFGIHAANLVRLEE